MLGSKKNLKVMLSYWYHLSLFVILVTAQACPELKL